MSKQPALQVWLIHIREIPRQEFHTIEGLAILSDIDVVSDTVNQVVANESGKSRQCSGLQVGDRGVLLVDVHSVLRQSSK